MENTANESRVPQIKYFENNTNILLNFFFSGAQAEYIVVPCDSN